MTEPLLKPYQQRVVEEKKELDAKIERIAAFLDSEEFNNVEADEQHLIVQQEFVMVIYSNVLSQRIAAFK